MKSLQDLKQEFLKQANEYDTGKKEEDFHAYLRHHKLDHYLSQTQIQDRQMRSNSLNGMGLVSGVAVPLTLGAIYGAQKLTSKLIDHGGHKDYNYDEALSLTGGYKPKYNANTLDDSNSLSGHNTRRMPMADSHIGQDLSKFF